MTKDEFDNYLHQRYEHQVAWYDRKAIRNKRTNNLFQLLTIFLMAASSVLAALGEDWAKWSAVGLSAFVALGTSFLMTFRNQELWFKYRSICETLRKEKYFYQAGIDEYGSSKDPMKLFVKRVESLISEEHTVWAAPPAEEH
jgi:hypothetical protein